MSDTVLDLEAKKKIDPHPQGACKGRETGDYKYLSKIVIIISKKKQNVTHSNKGIKLGNVIESDQRRVQPLRKHV